MTAPPLTQARAQAARRQFRRARTLIAVTTFVSVGVATLVPDPKGVPATRDLVATLTSTTWFLTTLIGAGPVWFAARYLAAMPAGADRRARALLAALISGSVVAWAVWQQVMMPIIGNRGGHADWVGFAISGLPATGALLAALMLAKPPAATGS